MTLGLTMLTSFLLLIVISQINAYSSGAGFSSCDTMHPGHNQDSSDSEIPFTLVPNDVKVEVGQVIDLNLIKSIIAEISLENVHVEDLFLELVQTSPQFITTWLNERQ